MGTSATDLLKQRPICVMFEYEKVVKNRLLEGMKDFVMV